MNRQTSLFLAVLVCLISFTTAASALSSPSPSKNVKVIISFKDKINHKLITSVGGKTKDSLVNLPIVTAELPSLAIEDLKQNKDIEFIEEDGVWSATAQYIPWGVNMVNADEVQTKGISGNGVKVGVLDSGCSPHEDLSIAGGWNFINNTSNYNDDFGHGTHVTGIIAALNNDKGLLGVSPGAQIYALKVLDSSGNTTWSNVAKAIDWAITNKIRVINMSFGGITGSKTVERAINKAYKSGILLVAAAGNNGNRSDVLYPSKYTNVIAVGAVDHNMNIAPFSNTGSKLELVAPGVDISSTYLSNSYQTMSGTSMAAPHVSGIATLLWAKDSTLTNIKVRETLDKGVVDLGSAGWDYIYGYGLPNALACTR